MPESNEIPLDSLVEQPSNEVPLDSLVDDDEDEWEKMEEPSLFKQAGSAVLGAVGKVSRGIDSVTGAPIRSAVGAMQEGKNPREVIGAGIDQFGKNPDLAPSGKDIAAKFGLSTEEFDTKFHTTPSMSESFQVSPAGLAGTVIEAGLDPTTYITGGNPLQAFGKQAGKGLGKGLTKSTTKAAASMEPALTRFLEQKAAERAVKAATGNSVSGIRKLAKVTKNVDYEKAADNLLKSGTEMLKPDETGNRVVGWFDSPESVAPKAAARKDLIGSQMNEVGGTVDKTIPDGAISSWEIAKDLQDYRDNLPMGGVAQENLKKRLDSEIGLLKQKGNISFEEAQQLKNSFKYKPQESDALLSNQDLTNDINRIIGKRMEESTGKAGVLDQYKDLKNQYGVMSAVEQASGDRSLQNLANRVVSPSDYASGATGVIAGAAKGQGLGELGLYGFAMAAANKLLRERGSAVAANSLRKLAEISKTSPEFLGKYKNVLEKSANEGARSLVVTHHLLMNNDPMYRKLFEDNPNK